MATLKPNNFLRGRSALLATACLMIFLTGGKSQADPNPAEIEFSRRSGSIDEAQELLRKGDQAYTAMRYAEAVEAYAGARELIPDAPISTELRAAATERYAQASIESAHQLSRKGDVAAAKAAIAKVLSPSIAPNHPSALACQAQLDDPIRTNSALTAKHAKDIDTVRQLLYTAQGAFDLGKFDQAQSTYQKVLRVDPTNSAARRGLEQIASAKSGYSQSAYDHTRAEMLGQVESQWQLKVQAPDLNAPLDDPAAANSAANFISVKDKLSRIIIPTIQLSQTNLPEAIESLRLLASTYDTFELDPARKGIDFIINLGPPESSANILNLRFNLILSQAPLSEILKYITENTHTSFTTDHNAVTIISVNSTSPELVAQTYRVPPDFNNTMNNSGAGTAESENLFNTAPATNGLLAKRVGAKEFLSNQGVTFPPGASAVYNLNTNSLRVINTSDNQAMISQFIQTLTQTEPVLISVQVTMIEVAQTRLEELGFDSFLENISTSQNLVVTGGTQGNGKGSPDVIKPSGTTRLNPITAGNRSGDTAVAGNTIDELIENQNNDTISKPAPGVFGVYGKIGASNVQALMRGLNQKKGTDIMAQPAIVTRNNVASSIKIIRGFMYPTAYQPPTVPNSVNPNSVATPVTPSTPNNFVTRDVGITLGVTPIADANKQYISLTLAPSFTDFQGFVNYGSPINSVQQGLINSSSVQLTKNDILMPVFSEKSLTTTVDIADGATIALGGMLRESIDIVEDKTPILGSLPIVGRLFQSSVKRPVSKTVLFLVKVELIDPTGHPYRNR